MSRKYFIILIVIAATGLAPGLLFAADNVTETQVLTKNQALAKTYSDGWVIAYLDTNGGLKSYSAKSAEDLSAAKAKIQETYDKKKAAYDKANTEYLKRNPGMKYGQLPPIEPSFTPIEAHVVRSPMGNILSVTPKENVYALYKVRADGRTLYEAGYEFSTATQQLRHERRYRQQYNAWVRDGKNGEAPAEPQYEKVSGELTKTKAAKAAEDFSAWQNKYDAWEKHGKEEGKEPKQPDIADYRESAPDTVVRQRNNDNGPDRLRGPGIRINRRGAGF